MATTKKTTAPAAPKKATTSAKTTGVIAGGYVAPKPQVPAAAPKATPKKTTPAPKPIGTAGGYVKGKEPPLAGTATVAKTGVAQKGGTSDERYAQAAYQQSLNTAPKAAAKPAAAPKAKAPTVATPKPAAGPLKGSGTPINKPIANTVRAATSAGKGVIGGVNTATNAAVGAARPTAAAPAAMSPGDVAKQRAMEGTYGPQTYQQMMAASGYKPNAPTPPPVASPDGDGAYDEGPGDNDTQYTNPWMPQNDYGPQPTFTRPSRVQVQAPNIDADLGQYGVSTGWDAMLAQAQADEAAKRGEFADTRKRGIDWATNAAGELVAPNKGEFTDPYDTELAGYKDRYAARQQQSTDLFREGLGRIDGKYAQFMGSAGSEYANRANEIAGGAARGNADIAARTLQGQTNLDAVNASTKVALGDLDKRYLAPVDGLGQISPDLAHAADAQKGVGLGALDPQVLQALQADGAREMGIQAAAANKAATANYNAALRAGMVDFAQLDASYFGDFQNNQNDLLSRGANDITGFLNGRTGALDKFYGANQGYAGTKAKIGADLFANENDNLDKAYANPVAQLAMGQIADVAPKNRANQIDLYRAQAEDERGYYEADWRYGTEQYKNEMDGRNTAIANDQDYASKMFDYDNQSRDRNYKTDQELVGTRYKADQDYNAAQYKSDNDLTGTQYTADKAFAGNTYKSDNDLRGDMYDTDADFKAALYRADKDFDGKVTAAEISSAGALDRALISDGTNRWKATLGAGTDIDVAKIRAGATVEAAGVRAATSGATTKVVRGNDWLATAPIGDVSKKALVRATADAKKLTQKGQPLETLSEQEAAARILLQIAPQLGSDRATRYVNAYYIGVPQTVPKGNAASGGSSTKATGKSTVSGGFPWNDAVAQKALKSGANPKAVAITSESQRMFGTGWDGIWGDEKHQGRKSDHNQGNATDLRIGNLDQGAKVANYHAGRIGKDVKYVIFNRQINTGSGWRKYTGEDPHTGHVHISVK